ncbi:MAG: hypothetical protein ACTSR3_01090 [Candidatus Helarchaeota archaeon]
MDNEKITDWEKFFKRNIRGTFEFQPAIPRNLGFEKVLGRKFNCFDCVHAKIQSDLFGNKLKKGTCNNKVRYKYVWILDKGLYEPIIERSEISKRTRICANFKLSDKTKAEIKKMDRKIEKNKKDNHPRYSLGEFELIL